jgi:hypothetical protein
MKFSKVPPRAEYLINFFEEGLSSLGAVCERSWHDRLEVLAEGDAARLWRNEGDFFSGELHFSNGGLPETGDPETEVFPGCPLTFQLVEAIWAHNVIRSLACLSTGSILKPPAQDVAQKLWTAQFGPCADWRLTTPFRLAWSFSLVIALRCEIQAIDQSWSCHRLAFTLPDGERDASLESILEQLSPVETRPEGSDWPAEDDFAVSDWIGQALLSDLAPELSRIKERQQNFLRRELSRIDSYFENYSRELHSRMARQRKEDAIKRYADRLEATRIEHHRRRTDQIERHTIHLLPHVDAVLAVAEPALVATVSCRAGRAERSTRAMFVPRTRRWHSSGNG